VNVVLVEELGEAFEESDDLYMLSTVHREASGMFKKQMG